MKLRGQILIASLLLTVLPLFLVMWLVRDNVGRRFAELDTRRVEDQIRLTRQDLDRQSTHLVTLLDALAGELREDNRFRLAVSGQRPDLMDYTIDYAARAMSLMDLELLLIQDAQGKVLSSGHFRGAFGLDEPTLPRLLSHVTSGQALVPARSPEGPFLALARTRTLELGGATYHLTAGLSLDAEHLRSLGRDPDLKVMIRWPGGAISSDPELAGRFAPDTRGEEIEFQLRRDGLIVRSAELPLVTPEGHGSALLLVVHDQGFMRGLLNGLNARLALVLAVALGISVAMAFFFSQRISRPLRQLALQTEQLDLDHLDAQFTSARRDEVGHLTRLLGRMTTRLRDSVGRLRAAEHKATLGEVARQVNHDIRNGLTPLRNVLRHLGEVADTDPQQLDEVFGQRRKTLDEGLGYLEELAAHYARLSPPRNVQPCRLAEIVDQSLLSLQAAPGVTLENKLGTNLPTVLADPVSLRRIFDNLVRNALESLPEGQGTISVNAFLEEDPLLEEMRVLVEVADTGEGIAQEHLDDIFQDFFTTRSQGTGLGLSNVRRLAADCGAQVRVASQVGQGTTFTLSFPVSGMS
jgi:signal transduction histidine kinase